jgi:osmotically-inducible protein OsmY
VVHAARVALAGDPRVELARGRLELSFSEGVLTMEGELPGLAAKKLALEHAAGVPGVGHIVDRVRVRPACAMADAEICDHLCGSLAGEPAFLSCAVRFRRQGWLQALREPARPSGQVEVSVQQGVVVLSGEVPSLAHKRLAGVLAWWVPGTRDVVNGLEVVPEEEDSQEELAEAVRTALEKDPLVDEAGIRVGASGAVVTLEGSVRSEPQRELAENDAWCVFAVDAVVNRIEVRGP